MGQLRTVDFVLLWTCQAFSCRLRSDTIWGRRSLSEKPLCSYNEYPFYFLRYYVFRYCRIFQILIKFCVGVDNIEFRIGKDRARLRNPKVMPALSWAWNRQRRDQNLFLLAAPRCKNPAQLYYVIPFTGHSHAGDATRPGKGCNLGYVVMCMPADTKAQN